MPVPQSTMAVLTARDLRRERAGQVVLADVSVTVGPDSRIGVIGPNGVGKTTLLRILAGLDRPDGGVVELAPTRATVGYLAQEPDRDPAETVASYLRRRTGVALAEAELE
ncbi:MAG: ATP-binding cassette domain-containing protein, partial [Acidimicrobiales bacterium]